MENFYPIDLLDKHIKDIQKQRRESALLTWPIMTTLTQEQWKESLVSKGMYYPGLTLGEVKLDGQDYELVSDVEHIPKDTVELL